MKIDSDEFLYKLDEIRESLIADLVKKGDYSEWNKGILAGKIDMIDEIKYMVSSGGRYE